jgi:PPK2 family polyphosphate:nucleotide phosphotransferase
LTLPNPHFHGDPPLAKQEAESLTQKALERLSELQERLYAERRRSLLVVLQGPDTSGKGGTIRKVGGAFYPAGFRVVSFKVPSAEELSHDFLWRIHRETPRRGEVVFFDRSHYEDVLVVRVDRLAPKSVWRKRYEQINAFEKHLADNGTAIVKFFLHISRQEQRERLEARRDDPTKQWKFSADDVVKRRQWSAYRQAYRDALERCHARWAPWVVVPADHKWYRNLVVARELVRILERLDPKYPKPAPGLSKLVIR